MTFGETSFTFVENTFTFGEDTFTFRETTFTLEETTSAVPWQIVEETFLAPPWPGEENYYLECLTSIFMKNVSCVGIWSSVAEKGKW